MWFLQWEFLSSDYSTEITFSEDPDGLLTLSQASLLSLAGTLGLPCPWKVWLPWHHSSSMTPSSDSGHPFSAHISPHLDQHIQPWRLCLGMTLISREHSKDSHAGEFMPYRDRMEKLEILSLLWAGLSCIIELLWENVVLVRWPKWGHKPLVSYKLYEDRICFFRLKVSTCFPSFAFSRETNHAQHKKWPEESPNDPWGDLPKR